MTHRIFCLFVCAACLLVTVPSARAHESFQDILKEQYMLRTFSCKACHEDNDNRKSRTPFADRIYQELKPLNLSEKYAKALAADEAAKAKDPDSVGREKGAVYEFEKSIEDDFKKAFKVVAQQKMTIDEILKQGLFAGARLDTRKIEEAREEKGEEGK